MATQTKTAKAAKKTPAKKAASKSAGTTASKTAAAAKKAPAKTAKATAAKTAAKTPAKKAAAKAAPATKAAATAKKTPAKAVRKAPAKTAAKTTAKATAAASTDAESTLSAADIKEFTGLITEELERVRKEYDDSVAILNELKVAGQDSAGDDPADTGNKTFEREQEMSIANNRLDLINQMERAMSRIKAGTYGVCESCGEMIPKARLQAFPQATLCVACKSREERR